MSGISSIFDTLGYFRVKTYDKDRPEVAFRLDRRHGERPTVARVLSEVVKILRLKTASKQLFGLFAGALGNPTLLLDHEDTLDFDQEVCLQRVSFFEDEEIKLVRDDPRALKLLFWETVDAYERGKIIPKVDSETSCELNSILARAGTYSTLPGRAMASFMLFVQSIPYYYWSLYYRADDCILQCSATIAGQDILEGTDLRVALNAKEFVLLDSSGTNEVASWFWDEVHQLRLYNKSSLHQLVFEVINEDEELKNDVFQTIRIASDKSQYIYSVAVYILNILERKQAEETNRSYQEYRELINPGFRKKLLAAKPRAGMFLHGD